MTLCPSRNPCDPDCIPDITGIPVVAVSGFSNSGKTTLIESLVRKFSFSGICTAVIKQYSKSFSLDQENKDTNRFYKAGATVCGIDSHQLFIRQSHLCNRGALDVSLILKLAENHDLVLIEGRKNLSVPVKIWLRRYPDDHPPQGILPVAADLEMDNNRVEKACDTITSIVNQAFDKRPLFCGIYSHYSKNQQCCLLNDLHESTLISELTPRIKKICFPHIDIYPGKVGVSDGVVSTGATESFAEFIVRLLRSHPHSSWIILKNLDLKNMPVLIDLLLSASKPGIWTIFPKRLNKFMDANVVWLDSRVASLFHTSSAFEQLLFHPKTVILDW